MIELLPCRDIHPKGKLLRARGRNPYIAQLQGFEEQYRYQRRFWGRREEPGQVSIHLVPQQREIFLPALLDIRHGDIPERRQWFILHGTDVTAAQLTEVTQGAIDVLLGNPLFVDYGVGVGNIGRLLDATDVDGIPRGVRGPAEVLMSPYDGGEEARREREETEVRERQERARRTAELLARYERRRAEREALARWDRDTVPPVRMEQQRVPWSVRDHSAARYNELMRDLLPAPGISGDEPVAGNETVLFAHPDQAEEMRRLVDGRGRRGRRSRRQKEKAMPPVLATPPGRKFNLEDD